MVGVAVGVVSLGEVDGEVVEEVADAGEEVASRDQVAEICLLGFIGGISHQLVAKFRNMASSSSR